MTARTQSEHRILKLVARHDVPCYFFIIGNASSYRMLSHATNEFMPADTVDGTAAADRAAQVDFGFRTRQRIAASPTACS